MAIQKLTTFINDSSELPINLEWAGEAFDPAGEWALIFTAKNSDADLDDESVFQKASGAGIEVDGSVATVSLVPSDTESLADGRLLFDIQAQSAITQKVRTVAYGELYVMRDITRLTETSVPVTTTESPLPFVSVASEIHNAASKATPVDADEIGIVDSAASWLIKKVSWANIKATIISDTAYNSTNWNGVTDVAPSKNAVRDKLETMAGAIVDPSALTYAGVNPNVPETLVVSHDGAADVSVPRIADYNGYPSWENGAYRVAWSAGVWEIIFPGYIVDKVSPALTPVGLTDWSAGAGETQPTVSSGNPIATYLGQFCQASTAWWQWDGSAWIPIRLLNGRPITRDDADTAYFSLGVDAIGLPTTTPFSLT